MRFLQIDSNIWDSCHRDSMPCRCLPPIYATTLQCICSWNRHMSICDQTFGFLPFRVRRQCTPLSVLLFGKSYGLLEPGGKPGSPWLSMSRTIVLSNFLHFFTGRIGGGRLPLTLVFRLENPRTGGLWLSFMGSIKSRIPLKWLGSKAAAEAERSHCFLNCILMNVVEIFS